jgi:hypothetical protein
MDMAAGTVCNKRAAARSRTLFPAALLFMTGLAPSLGMLFRAPDLPMLGRFNDDTVYLECARSLASGSGYRIPSLSGQPFQTKYPPLWPLLLSMVWKVNPNFPNNLSVAGVLAWAAVPAYLALAWITFVRWGLGRTTCRLLLLVLACHNLVLLFSATIMADLWFAAALLACLLCAERATSAERGNRAAAFAGALGAVAYLIKSSALPLLLSLPLCFSLRRQYRRAALSLFSMLPAVASWNLWVRAHATHSSDLASLYNTSYLGFYLYGFTRHDIFHMVAVNLRMLLSSATHLFMLEAGGSFLEDALCAFVIVAALSGLVRLIRCTGYLHYTVFAVGYVAQLVAWHYPPTARLLLPVLALLLAGIGAEIAHALRLLRSGRPARGLSYAVSLATLGLCGPLLLYWGVASYGVVFRSLPAQLAENRRITAGKRAAYEWISTHTPAAAGVLASDDELLHLYTGRHAASQIVLPVLTYRGDEEALKNQLRSLPECARALRLDYVLVTSSDLARESLERFRPLLTEAMRGAPGFVRVYHSNVADVYMDEWAGARAAPTVQTRMACRVPGAST